MPHFSDESIRRLASCDTRLQLIMKEAIKITDFAVLEGYRTNEEQDTLRERGLTKIKGGDGKHNKFPSLAVDLAPWPIDWEDSLRFCFLAGIITALAYRLGIKIRWGGDWDGDGDLKNQAFHDLGHFELVDD